MLKSYDITYQGHYQVVAESKAEALDIFYDNCKEDEFVLDVDEIGNQDDLYDEWRENHE